MKADWKEVEVDIMYNFVYLPQAESHSLEQVQGKFGFVRLPYTKLYSKYFRPVIETFHKDHHIPYSEAEYISPLIVKGNARHILKYKDEHDCASHLTSFLIGTCSIKGSDSLTETTLEVTVNIDAKDGPINVCIDHVPAVRLHFWPHQATARINRTRIWPPEDIVKSIRNRGCQLVPRSSPGSDVDSEWRLSFSVSEATLVLLRSQEQHHAYYFFKILFYRYLKNVESSEPHRKSLFSYIMKTTMLWACEELPPEDRIWASLESSTQMLLFKLSGSLEAGFLPHYFIVEINLLERIGEDVRGRCTAIIESLQSNLLLAAPFDMPEKREIVKDLAARLSLACTIGGYLSRVSDSESVLAILKRLFLKEET